MTRPVLLVDDDPGILFTVREILEEEGYRVIAASDGLEALEALERTRPALILLDLMMPRMDGYALFQEMGRRGLRPAIPVVVLSGDVHAAEKTADYKAEALIAKPFELDELLEAVARHGQW